MILAKNFEENDVQSIIFFIRHMVDESFILTTQCIILKIVGF